MPEAHTQGSHHAQNVQLEQIHKYGNARTWQILCLSLPLRLRSEAGTRWRGRHTHLLRDVRGARAQIAGFSVRGHVFRARAMGLQLARRLEATCSPTMGHVKRHLLATSNS
jgi:hypothetical protein